MNDIQRLRTRAIKARRLAAGVNDPISKDALTHYATECDEQADRLELIAKTDNRQG